MRRRCQLLCCIEIIDNAYFSQNLICCYIIVVPTLNFASGNRIPHSPAATSDPIPSLAPSSTQRIDIHQANLPLLEHRKRSHIVSSQGRAIFPPSVSPSESTQVDSSSPLTVAHNRGPLSHHPQWKRAGPEDWPSTQYRDPTPTSWLWVFDESLSLHPIPIQMHPGLPQYNFHYLYYLQGGITTQYYAD